VNKFSHLVSEYAEITESAVFNLLNVQSFDERNKIMLG